MIRSGTALWFARHELRLAWRDWVALITAGRRRRAPSVVLWFIAFALFMHVVALFVVARYAEIGVDPDKPVLLAITGSAALSWTLMLSQAIESVTRGFYARADLDLILSSPVAARRMFSVRIAAMALTIAFLGLLLSAPFIDVLAARGGLHWLAAYGVVVAMAMAATALAVPFTIALFLTVGPKRTRLVAQIASAVIGAAFAIGLQIAAILSYGTLSRTVFLQSAQLAALAPDGASILWWPARAILGDLRALVLLFGASLLLLTASILLFAPRFALYAIAAAEFAGGARRPGRATTGFRRASPRHALRRKEWALLRRDPWLVSQSLMQLLYLLPPAVLLWHSFAAGTGAPALLAPVLVMAGGQLGGGLAWLAISGEDAPDLVASAPVPGGQILRAKIESVMGGVGIVFLPFIAALSLVSPFAAAVSACGVTIAAASSTGIQLAFRNQAKRSHFRRRHTSSRVATIAEALSSVSWAATGALAASRTWLALMPGVLAVMILLGVRAMSPTRT
jgi:ABC-2 type transport system permease protein